MMRKINKMGQFQISFGMIFSIILIISFIAVAFYVIKLFLGMKDCGEIGTLYKDLQESVTNAKRSPETSQTFSSILPSSIDYVCIIDLGKGAKGPRSSIYDELSLINKNLALYPNTKCSGLGGINLAGIDLETITSSENPFCIPVANNKVSMVIEKGIYDKSVKISRTASSSTK